MAKSMKAAVVTAFKAPLVIREVPVPEVSANQILMKVEASGVCHTDLHAAHGDWPVKPTPPSIPGHEGVGFVAVGRDVKGVKEGDRIGVPWLHRLRALPALPHRLGDTLPRAAEHRLFGQWRLRRLTWSPTRQLRAESSRQASGSGRPRRSLCRRHRLQGGSRRRKRGRRVGGGLAASADAGHMAVQYAKAMGLHCAAIDVHPEKLELATKLGADMVINAREEDPGPALHKAMGGVHGVLVTAVSPRAFAQAQAMLRRRGTMVLVRLPPGDFPLPIFDAVLNRITVRGSIVGTRQDLVECLEFAGEGKVKPHFSWEPLDAINDIFHRMEQEKIEGRIVMRL